MAHREVTWQRRIGIVGGLGPYAHIELERQLLDAAQSKLGGGVTDQRLPSWMVASLPQTPDRTQALLGGGASPVPLLLRSLDLLQGCDFAVIACNTAHAYLPELRRLTRMPILDVVAETVKQAIARYGENARIGLLATTGTVESAIYPAKSVELSGLTFLTPLHLQSGDQLQALLMDSIFGVPFGLKAGGHRDVQTRNRLRINIFTVVSQLKRMDISAIVLGCSELSLVLDEETIDAVPVLDPMKLVARAAVDIAAGDRDLPLRNYS